MQVCPIICRTSNYGHIGLEYFPNHRLDECCCGVCCRHCHRPKFCILLTTKIFLLSDIGDHDNFFGNFINLEFYNLQSTFQLSQPQRVWNIEIWYLFPIFLCVHIGTYAWYMVDNLVRYNGWNCCWISETGSYGKLYWVHRIFKFFREIIFLSFSQSYIIFNSEQKFINHIVTNFLSYVCFVTCEG